MRSSDAIRAELGAAEDRANFLAAELVRLERDLAMAGDERIANYVVRYRLRRELESAEAAECLVTKEPHAKQ